MEIEPEWWSVIYHHDHFLLRGFYYDGKIQSRWFDIPGSKPLASIDYSIMMKLVEYFEMKPIMNHGNISGYGRTLKKMKQKFNKLSDEDQVTLTLLGIFS